MSVKFSKIILALILLTVFANLLIAQRNNRHDMPISEEQYKDLQKRIDSIQSDNSKSQNEWAGLYYQGSHHPTKFYISENKGFAMWGSHHRFFPTGLNYGEVKFSSGSLKLKPEIPKDNLHYMRIANELTPVLWREERYLIPKDGLKSFAYAVHSRVEAQLVGYLSKADNEDKKRFGLPNLPKEYESILKMKPIKGKIINIHKDNTNSLYEHEITLNVGRNKNVEKEMTFFYTKRNLHFMAEVIEVNEKTTKVGVWNYFSEDDGKHKLKVGMKLSTQANKDYFYVE